jgi:hypothetical protein
MSPLRSWLLVALAILISVGAFLTVPFKGCEDCDQTGIQLIGPIGSERPPCGRCDGRGRLSFLRQWTTKPQVTFVGAASVRDVVQYIMPLLDREGIPLLQGEGGHGWLGFSSDSPPHAVRARKLIEQDAREKNYRFR